ncbi:RNA polymerase subunit sigma-28 (plasmid) [Caballeronia sp. NK8]|nr:RNA polymerase subunit sigma-28 [Caballeronia sp. NK8]
MDRLEMKTVIRYRNVAKLSRPDLHQMIERLAERVLGPHLSHFPAELLRLHATLDRSRHHGLYRVRLQMTLSGATLACVEESSRLEKAIEHAFTELDRQVERHVAHLRHEDAWRRKERRVGLRQLKTALNEESDAETASFSSLGRPLLASLQRFVQRELSDLQVRGELDPGEPSVDEIVDEALARACEQSATRSRKLNPLQWLYQITLSVLADEVSRRQDEAGRCISLEGRLPIELREPREDEEILFAYWQPDEVLRLEDVMPAADATPEEAVSEQELRALLATLLSELPAPWRRAVVLCRLEGLAVGAAAQVAGVTEQALEQGLTHADAFLRARLGALRLIPQASDEPAGYVMPGVLPPASSLSQKFEQATRRDVREPEKQRR